MNAGGPPTEHVMATTQRDKPLTAFGTMPMTAHELAARPKEERRGELIRGVFCPTMPTGPLHALVLVKLSRLLGNAVDAAGIGFVLVGDPGVHLASNPDTVRAPDLAFYEKGRMPPLADFRGFLQVVPDLVVEVVSPDDTPREVDAKAQMWLYNGVRLVWVVWPAARMVEVYRPGEDAATLREDDTLTGETIAPSFSCVVEDIFADIPVE